MITPRRRKQSEREETHVETATFTEPNELELPPTPLKSPNHRARRRPRPFGPHTANTLFSYAGRTNLDFHQDKQAEDIQQCKEALKFRLAQEEPVESENVSKSQELCGLQKSLSGRNSSTREASSTVESSIPLYFSPASEKPNTMRRNDCERDDWMQDVCSPVTEQKLLATSQSLETNTPKGYERVLTCPYCHKKWIEEARVRCSPSVRRCSLCSPIRAVTNPAPCNMNPFSPEVRSQGLKSPQEDNSSEMPTSSISCSTNVSKSLAFDSSSFLLSRNDSCIEQLDTNDEEEEEEEDHLSFSSFSLGRLSSYKDDFEEIEEIGSGTFGKVFKCRQRLDGWLYAVKSSRRKIRNQAEKQNVLREVYALAAMTDNPYVVRYFSAWIEDDILYIQTELCEGGSIMSLWRNGMFVFDTERMREFIYQVASGLAIYHEKGLAHLDIKPENIYMTSHGAYKIGDLGLTALADQTLLQGKYRIDLSEGDSRYIAPELLEENYEHLTKADIYSLGMSAYELCRASQQPLPSGGEEWHQIRRGYLEPMTVDSELVSLIREMLCPDPCLRPCARDVIRRLGLEDKKDIQIAQLAQQLDQERQRCKTLEAIVTSLRG